MTTATLSDRRQRLSADVRIPRRNCVLRIGAVGRIQTHQQHTCSAQCWRSAQERANALRKTTHILFLKVVAAWDSLGDHMLHTQAPMSVSHLRSQKGRFNVITVETFISTTIVLTRHPRSSRRTMSKLSASCCSSGHCSGVTTTRRFVSV
mgnify:CR=1 FL=1